MSLEHEGKPEEGGPVDAGAGSAPLGALADFSSSWSGQGVDVNSIKAALRRLLQELNPPQEGQSHPPVKASLLSRIVVLDRGAENARAMEAMGELARLHPSRTMMISVDRDAPPGLDADATVYCQLQTGMQPRVCFEEIRLTARGDLAGQLSSVVVPLLIPDMPVVLWWIGEPPAEDDELLRICNRLTIDSDPLGAQGPDRVQRLVAAMGPGKIVTDLAWAELSPWQDVLAQLFDPLETRPYQRTLDRVEIQYAAGTTSSRPLLMAGWLASTFGWALEARETGEQLGEGRHYLRGAAGQVELHLTPRVAPSRSAGELLSVSLSSGSGEGKAFLSVTRYEDGVCATMRTRLPDHLEQSRVVPLARPSWASLLSGELDRRKADPAYLASLALASKLAQA